MASAIFFWVSPILPPIYVVVQRGEVSDSDLQHARVAGLTDGEIVETVANVVLNIFTNYAVTLWKARRYAGLPTASHNRTGPLPSSEKRMCCVVTASSQVGWFLQEHLRRGPIPGLL